MIGASRLLRGPRAVHSDGSPSSSSSSPSPSSAAASFCLPHLRFPWSAGERGTASSGIPQAKKKRAAASLDAAVVVSPEKKQRPLAEKELAGIAELVSLASKLASAMAIRKYWMIYAEMLVEKGIIGCRSMTLIPVTGSLIGSVLCFVEGCFFVVEAFLQQFQVMSKNLNHGAILQPLIEAIDMFLVGTALLTFGMGLYVMFSGSDATKSKSGLQTVRSNFGSFDLKKLADYMDIQSITQAKSKLGHAVILILQAGVVEQFKNVPLTSGLDLACLAGALFISSACVFVLSKLTIKQ